MERRRRTFSREFKLEAVKLVTERGVTVAQAAKDLDVHENVLRKWVRELREAPQEAFPGNGRQTAQDAELARLRKEVAKLKMERDILKKAAADSTGRRNTFNHGGVYGTTRGVDAQVSGARCNALTRCSFASARGRAAVLGADCHRNYECEGGRGRWRVATGGHALVLSSWRHAIVHVGPHIGKVSVVSGGSVHQRRAVAGASGS
ncbi:transposase [Variovorax sp. CF313]|nr:transposase [Variovorax sp. CF313]